MPTGISKGQTAAIMMMSSQLPLLSHREIELQAWREGELSLKTQCVPVRRRATLYDSTNTRGT